MPERRTPLLSLSLFALSPINRYVRPPSAAWDASEGLIWASTRRGVARKLPPLPPAPSATAAAAPPASAPASTRPAALQKEDGCEPAPVTRPLVVVGQERADSRRGGVAAGRRRGVVVVDISVRAAAARGLSAPLSERGRGRSVV
jgi:hypothetical protein